jgi:hypothetical protein
VDLHNDELLRLVFGQTLCGIALVLHLVLAYPGIRIPIFEADVIPFLRGQTLTSNRSRCRGCLRSVWTISAGYMRQITLTLTGSVKIACLYISVDPIVTRMTHDNKRSNKSPQARTTTHGNIVSKGMVIVQMHDEWGIVVHLVVC